MFAFVFLNFKRKGGLSVQTLKKIDAKFYKALGQRLREVRHHRGVDLKELSQLTGFSRSLLDHWELGYNKITQKQYETLCKALNITTEMDIDVRLQW